ncbi:hypothetical protein [Rosenbergiella australiborealis]|nr:hypothetical protein [Rosenbergiella australiborealis]
MSSFGAPAQMAVLQKHILSVVDGFKEKTRQLWANADQLRIS